MAELILLSDYIEKLQSVLKSDPDAVAEIGSEWTGSEGDLVQVALVTWNPEKAHEANVISAMNRIADDVRKRHEQDVQNALLDITARAQSELDASVRRHPAGKDKGKGKTSIWPFIN